jgi:peptide/nickel transport system permease protein
MPKFVLLWTDVSMWLLMAAVLAYVRFVLVRPNSNQLAQGLHRCACPVLELVLVLCLLVTLLDSLHYRPLLPAPGVANAPAA